MNRKIMMVLGAVVVIAGIVYSFRPAPVTVEVGPVERLTVREFVSEEAKVRLADVYTVDMPIHGTLERITLLEGDWVGQEEIVAQIDPFEIEAHIAGIRALIAQANAHIAGVDIQKPKDEDLASAEVQVQELRDELAMAEGRQRVARLRLEEAERERARVALLVSRGIASDQDLERATDQEKAASEELILARLAREATGKRLEMAELASSRVAGSVDDNEYLRDAYEAERANLEAQLLLLGKDLKETTVRAPVGGPVLNIFVKDRRVLPAGTPILEVGNQWTMEIESDILSEEVVRVKVDDKVEIEGRALGDDVLEGLVTRIYPAAFTKISSLGIEQQRVKTIIKFVSGKPDLRPGTRLDVRIVTAESEDTMAVPERATFRRDGQWCVFVAEGGRARIVPVEIGLRNNAWAEILSGLESDATIIYEPHNDLEEGSRLRLR